MATMNPFELLGHVDDAEDPSLLVAVQQKQKQAPPAAAAPKKAPQPQSQSKPAKLPSKPLPPFQAVREAKNDTGRGAGRAGGRGYGRGRGGYNQDSVSSDSSLTNAGAPAGQGAPEDGDAERRSERRGYGGPRGSFRGGRRGVFTNEEVGEGERPRRAFDRHSGTGRGNELKREGAGRGNWGAQTDELAQVAEEAATEVQKNLNDGTPLGEEAGGDGNKESPTKEPEEKEPEDKEMTLEEYQKVLEEKRKALQALKTEERKVDAKAFESMQQLSSKKSNDDVFIKLGSDKDKRKEAYEKDEKAKKSLSINEFLKPTEGERHYSPGGRGRGRGRVSRGYGGRDATSNAPADFVADPGQFPTLGGK